MSKQKTSIEDADDSKRETKIKWPIVFNLQTSIALLAIFGIVVHLILRFTFPPLHPYQNYPLYIVLGLGGVPLVYDLLKKLVSFEFGSDLLAGISIVTAILLDEYLAGSLVVLMLSGGEALESYAIRKASRVLEALAKRAPTIAHLYSNGVITDIKIEQIKVGDVILIYPHEICPVDGIVKEGYGVMDEAYLTGEPYMIDKISGSHVISGATNGDSSLKIEASKLAIDSRYAKIMEVMHESEQRRPRIRRLADTLGAWYTPTAILIASLAWYISGEALRFLAVLVIATPCPLLIAIPVAIIGSISLCASRGILIKNPVVLERLDQCKTMIFDKTGTLTIGEPALVDQITYNSIPKKDLLRLVASLEKYSKHPLANAILKEASKENIELLDAKQIKEEKGFGLRGTVNGTDLTVTSRKQLEKLTAKNESARIPQMGEGLECVILTDGQLAGYYRFKDTPKKNSRSFVHHLLPKHGIKKIMIVSGDREETVKQLADSMGIKEMYGNQSPEDKVAIVRRETAKQSTAYIGDGINDAPALISATVGIALGKNSDITSEAAGAVILDNSLEKVDEFIHISSRMRHIALQSAVGGMVLSIIGMIIAAFGFLPPVAGAISQEIIDVAAILNSLRTIRRPKHLSDIPPHESKL